METRLGVVGESLEKFFSEGLLGKKERKRRRIFLDGLKIYSDSSRNEM